MKKSTREHRRSLKISNGQQKLVQSQSPPQKNFIKKIQFKHPEPTHKSDLSLQDQLVFQEPKPAVQDFRSEIEKRYHNSYSNYRYEFPRHKGNEKSSSESPSSSDSSFSSLKHVTVYDLASQNNKRKVNRFTELANIKLPASEAELNPIKSDKHHMRMLTEIVDNERINYTEAQKVEDIYEKGHQSYKRLLNLLDKQCLTSASTTKNITSNSSHQNYPREKLESFFDLRAHNKSLTMKNTTLKSKLSERTLKALAAYSSQTSQTHIKDTKPKSQERNPEYNLSKLKEDPNAHFFSTLDSKNFHHRPVTRSRVIPSIDTNSFTLDKSFKNGLPSSSNKIVITEGNRAKQDSLKRIYSNHHMLRMIAPQTSKNMIRVKDAILREDVSESLLFYHKPVSPSNTLYHKAQNEVLNNKTRPIIEKAKKVDSTACVTLLSPSEREGTPKNRAKNQNPMSLYMSPSTMTTIHSSQSKLSKKSSLKTTFVISPAGKSRELPVFASRETPKIKEVTLKKAFKLSFNKRTQDNRETVPSSRSRSRLAAEKITDGQESMLRVSYELPQYNSYNSFANAPTPQRSGKKKIAGIVGHNNSFKIISFGKNSSHIQLKRDR